ncbi:MAG: phosphoribosylglycinamide formyltransferase [Saprospiraceae bacterium]
MSTPFVSKTRILLLASGGGSNAACIMAHFADHAKAEVVAVVSDRKYAGVHEKAKLAGIRSVFIGPKRRKLEGGLLAELERHSPDVVVLAGYLQLIPTDVLARFPERVINIHPALLPKHGGPGMYGAHIHRAVKEAGDVVSGITIHLANEEYDKGRVLAQESVALAESDSPEDIGRKVLALEHLHYPRVLEMYLESLNH